MNAAALALALAVAVAACGEGELGRGSLLPLAQGNRWVYVVSDPKLGEIEKVQEVTGQATLSGVKAGVEAWVVETRQGSERTLAYYDEGTEGVRRHLEEVVAGSAVLERRAYLPFALRVLPGGVVPGHQQVQSYREQVEDGGGAPLREAAFDVTWRVEAEESVTVPAGTFRALRIKKTRDSEQEKIYWWVPGVGKVKEQGQRTELLKSYELR